MNWNQRLAGWTGPSSDSEDAKRERIERQIRAAVEAHPRLSKEPLKVYAKGSYANNTNVRLDSDIDINVEYQGGFYYDGVGDQDDQITKAAAGITDYTGPYSRFATFKSDVQEALEASFGNAVSRGNKCIRIRGSNTTHPADVVPCWEYRYYFRSWRGGGDYHQGTVLFPDRGSRVVNYPRQHYENGVAKNKRTLRRYKQTVRAIKRLENEMVDKQVIAAVPSYLIESLVYRCPDDIFLRSDFLEIARGVLATAYEATKGPEPDDENERWLEANDIKFLFHHAQAWTRDEANNFTLQAWRYLGLS